MVLRILFLILASIFGLEKAVAFQQSNGADEAQRQRTDVFDKVVALVAEHFFEKDFDSNEWRNRAAKKRKSAIEASSHDEFSDIINGLLETLGASHTRYFSKLDPKRYQLLGVFHRLYDESDTDLFIYEGIGIDHRRIDEKNYVTAVFDGFSADQAGLNFGDEIVAVDGKAFHPINSFKGKAGKEVQLSLLRQGKQVTLTVAVELLDGRSMFESALENSAKVLEHGGKQIGYVHAWSYAGTKYQEQIRSLVLWGKLSQCDALILDLRDGWGGADVNYLNLFREPIVTIETSSRSQAPVNYTGVWGKPVALVTNNRSTSGKELFTFGFKKLQLGKVFGETTAGAVLGGRCFLLSNGDVLYLAVVDILIDGNRIEGIGVEPDFPVARHVQTPGDDDPQIKAALEYLMGATDKK